MDCPKKYGSYDVTNHDCPLCKQGLLYRGCSVCGDIPACAGWNDDDGTNCCECYKAKHKDKK